MTASFCNKLYGYSKYFGAVECEIFFEPQSQSFPPGDLRERSTMDSHLLYIDSIRNPFPYCESFAAECEYYYKSRQCADSSGAM